MKEIKAYQKAYYQKHIKKLRKRHRAHSRLVRKGLWIPVPSKKISEIKQKCGWCGDFCFGPKYLVLKRGHDRQIIVDNGCLLYLQRYGIINDRIEVV